VAESIIPKKRRNYCANTAQAANCVVCGEEFTSTRRGHIHCSKACWKKIYNEKAIAPPKKVACRFCEKVFSQRTSWQAFCSSSCRDKWTRNPESKARVKSCETCGSSFAPTKRWSQKYCRDECKKVAFSKASERYRVISRSGGLCHNCRKPKLPHSSYLCEDHWFNKIAASNGIKGRDGGRLVRKIIESQGYTCPYTGRTLILSLNASIDHKNPRSRFPDQVGLLENIEWVDVQVNSAKREMTKEEFLSFCKLVSSRF